MTDVTLIVPFYRNAHMLKRQVEEWNKYPPGVKVICVDDSSPEPALPIIKDLLETMCMVCGVDIGVRLGERCNCRSGGFHHHVAARSPNGVAFEVGECNPNHARIHLYRIGVDIPWNREGARNLGAHVATTDWIIHVDIDHVLPADAAVELLKFTPNPMRWYRFPRWRRGKADGTRRKDKIAADVEYGEIHPHGDSYMVRRDIYWQTGGYDEDYAGCLGGGGAFLRRLEELQPVDMLPAPIRLEVYTRDVIKDASDWSLSRDTTEWHNRRRKKAATGNDTPKNPLRFPWSREL